MYIGQTRFWWDRHGGSIGIRSSNMKTGSNPFECYLKKRWDIPAFQIYETDNDGIGSEIRLSLGLLWFSLNMLLWSSDKEPPIKPGDDRYAMNYRRWGWHWMDRRSFWFAWNWWHWSFDLPWITKVHVRTELMDPFGIRVICDRDAKGFSFKDQGGWERWCAAKKSVMRSFPYKYTTKRGVSQFVTASCVIMQTWRRRKWWFIPSAERHIDIEFSQEVGEGRGSYKGGCIGCGYTMKAGESIEQTLRRMEKERKFDR